MIDRATPSISVVCAVYNGAAYIRAAMESVVAQSLRPSELILVDDGSTDDFRSQLDTIEFPFPVKIIRQENSGQSCARNRAVEQSTGELIAFIDQDDIWYANHLELLHAAFLDDPQVSWVFSDVDHIDGNDEFVAFNLFNSWKIVHPKESLQDLLGSDIFVLPSASLVRKDSFVSAGCFDERLCGYEDDDLYIRMFRKGFKSKYVPAALSKWRIHSGSASYSERMDRSRKIFALKLISSFPNNPRLRQWWIRDLIAPRFFIDARNRCLLAIEEKDWKHCSSALSDMLFFIQFYATGTPKLKGFVQWIVYSTLALGTKCRPGGSTPVAVKAATQVAKKAAMQQSFNSSLKAKQLS